MVFSFRALKAPTREPLVCIIFNGKSTVFLIFALSHEMLSLSHLGFLSITGFEQFDHDVSRCMFPLVCLFVFCARNSLNVSELWVRSFQRVLKILSRCFVTYSPPFPLALWLLRPASVSASLEGPGMCARLTARAPARRGAAAPPTLHFALGGFSAVPHGHRLVL